MIKYVPTMLLMFRHHVASHASSIKGVMLTSVLTLIVGVIASCLFINMGLDKHVDEHGMMGRATLGMVWGKKILDRMKSGDAPRASTSDKAPSQPLSGTTFVIKNEITSPETKTFVDMLLDLGLEKTSDPRADVTFEYIDGAWEVSSSKPNVAAIVWSVLVREMKDRRRQAQKQTQVFGDTWSVFVKSESESLPETAKKYGARLILAYVLVLSPLTFWMVWSIGLAAYKTDETRQSGMLEPFALATTPVWVYFASKALAQSIISTALVAPILCLSSLFVNFVSWAVIPLVLVTFSLVIFTFSMVGVAQVMTVHHKYARVVGTILFAPTTPIFFLFFFTKPMLNQVEKHADLIVQGKRMLPIVDWTVPQALGMMAVVVPLCLAAVAGLCMFIEWRAGVRRTALCKI